MLNFLRRGGSNETGQHDSTTSSSPPRRKKTRDEVQRDLLEKLRQAARKQLEQKGLYTDDDVELDKALNQLAASHFERSYNYWYDDNATVCRPPRLAPNGQIASLAKSRSMRPEEISPGSLESYFRTVLAQSNLQGEIKDRAVQDLTNISRTALTDRLNSGINWNNEEYSRTFEYSAAEDPDGQRNSFGVDGILIFCNARLKEDDHEVSVCILYYMAVYYEVTSELVKRRTDFQNDAIASAKEFSNCSFRLRNETDLRRALEGYGETLFRMKFFEYLDDKPDDLAKHLRADDVKKRAALYSSNKSREEWFFELAKQYLDELQLQGSHDSMKKPAVSHLAQTLVEFSERAGGGQWESKPFNRVYNAPNAELQTRFSGFIFYYCKKGRTTRDRDVSVAYVFIMAAWYETAVES